MLKIIILILLLFCIIILFEEHKNIKAAFFWILLNFVLPIVGFIIYVLFGNGLKFKAKKMLLSKEKSTKNYLKLTKWHKNYLKNNTNVLNVTQLKVFKYLNNQFNINLWHNNKITFYNNGQEFFNAMLKDIKSAKSTINIQFYILKDDMYGKTFLDVLCKKAEEGTKIKLIYDAIGSRKTNKNFWLKLKEYGAQVVPFFPPMFKLNFLNFKLNYRNHKKIVIIDGKIAYTGGINIRADHMGKTKKLSPWRDTQIKVVGSAVYAIQDMFLNDYAFAANHTFLNEDINLYFPKPTLKTGNQVAVLQSGPQKNNPSILNSYLKIINMSSKFLIIQTPYFIVEKDMIQTILNAKKKGIKVVVMLPQKPDKKTIYMATLQNIKPLIKAGVEFYLYKGFLHAKTLTTENFLSIGSCNFDNRSFFLNFENTCLFFDKSIINKHLLQIKKDITNSTKLTLNKYKKISRMGILSKIMYKTFYKLL